MRRPGALRAIRAALLPCVLALTACTNPALPRFEATLAAQPSATVALAQWCAARLASPATIHALADRTARPAPADVRRALGVSGQEALGYRHVRLACGDVVLSDAQNWFVPARLTPAMNEALATSQTPFGTVVAPLHFTRERLAAKRGALPGCPEGTVLSHRAVLRRPDGAAISLVIECYTRAMLARANPKSRPRPGSGRPARAARTEKKAAPSNSTGSSTAMPTSTPSRRS
jgi:hypothetical protein